MLLFWSSLIVDGDVVRLGRWERWNVGVFGKVGRWEGGGWESGTGFSAVRENLENNTFFKKSGKFKGKKQNYDKVREFLGGAPFSVRPSVHLWRTLSGTVHHLIIIFGTHM